MSLYEFTINFKLTEDFAETHNTGAFSMGKLLCKINQIYDVTVKKTWRASPPRFFAPCKKHGPAPADYGL